MFQQGTSSVASESQTSRNFYLTQEKKILKKEQYLFFFLQLYKLSVEEFDKVTNVLNRLAYLKFPKASAGGVRLKASCS